MATPRDVLVMDVIGLQVGNLDRYRELVPQLAGFTHQAALVPVYAGSIPARQASIATGLLPQQHGLLFGGLDATMRGQPFWVRAARAGLKSAFFGNCPQLARASDVHMRSERDRLYTVPEHTDAFFQRGMPGGNIGEDFERMFAHFAARAMAGGCNFVWVENPRLAIAGAVSEAADKQARRDVADKFDQFLATLFDAAGDRAVVLVSSTARRRCEHGAPEPQLDGVAAHSDGRLFHAICGPEQAQAVADRLRREPCFGRVLQGPQRAELGVDCPEAGTVVAEIRPGWGFTSEFTRSPSESVGPDADPAQFPVVLARNLNPGKTSLGMCELAWLLQDVLTGTEYHDEA